MIIDICGNVVKLAYIVPEWYVLISCASNIMNSPTSFCHRA